MSHSLLTNERTGLQIIDQSEPLLASMCPVSSQLLIIFSCDNPQYQVFENRDIRHLTLFLVPCPLHVKPNTIKLQRVGCFESLYLSLYLLSSLLRALGARCSGKDQRIQEDFQMSIERIRCDVIASSWEPESLFECV